MAIWYFCHHLVFYGHLVFCSKKASNGFFVILFTSLEITSQVRNIRFCHQTKLNCRWASQRTFYSTFGKGGVTWPGRRVTWPGELFGSCFQLLTKGHVTSATFWKLLPAVKEGSRDQVNVLEAASSCQRRVTWPGEHFGSCQKGEDGEAPHSGHFTELICTAKVHGDLYCESACWLVQRCAETY
jgi:hypothetical protein